MSFALTFGGFGDFATLTQLIFGACKVLIDSYDATAQCEDLVRYLTSFNNALETVRPLINGEIHASLNGGFPPAVINAVRGAVATCQEKIRLFEQKIVALRDTDKRDKARLRAFGQRLRWTLSLSDEATKLQRTLAEQKGLIDTVLIASLAQQLRGPPVGRAPASHGVTLIDMMEQEIVVPAQFTFSLKTFDVFLDALFTERAGRVFVQSKAYRLTVSRTPSAVEEVSDENWDAVVQQDTVLEMAVLVVRKHDMMFDRACPTCKFIHHKPMFSNKALQCTYCQTVITVANGVTSQVPAIGQLAEQNSWQFMRRFHYVFQQGVTQQISAHAYQHYIAQALVTSNSRFPISPRT